MTKRERASAKRLYAKQAKAWKAGLRCVRCNGRCDDVHHTRGKLGALLLDKRFWVAVCRECHVWIGNNPAQARREGLLCALGQWNTMPEE